MRLLPATGLLLASLTPAQAVLQVSRPLERPMERMVEHLDVQGASRLAALARLGSLTETSLLVEVDLLEPLQEPVTLALDNTTVAEAVGSILPAQYTLRQSGALLVVEPRAGDRNRVLTLSLGELFMHPDSLSSLIPRLEYEVRKATGCNPQGYGWAGSPMMLAIPEIALRNATVETVVERVADAPEASMWIVRREGNTIGCIDNPGAQWQVGLYGFGRASTTCQTIFRSSAGARFIPSFPQERHFSNDCHVNNPWQRMPLLPPPPPQ